MRYIELLKDGRLVEQDTETQQHRFLNYQKEAPEYRKFASLEDYFNFLENQYQLVGWRENKNA